MSQYKHSSLTAPQYSIPAPRCQAGPHPSRGPAARESGRVVSARRAGGANACDLDRARAEPPELLAKVLERAEPAARAALVPCGEQQRRAGGEGDKGAQPDDNQKANCQPGIQHKYPPPI